MVRAGAWTGGVVRSGVRSTISGLSAPTRRDRTPDTGFLDRVSALGYVRPT